MKKNDINHIAVAAGFPERRAFNDLSDLFPRLERFAAMVEAAERNKLAAWMIERGYATGHGDTTEDLLQELEWQIAENGTNALVKGIEGRDVANGEGDAHVYTSREILANPKMCSLGDEYVEKLRQQFDARIVG